MGKWIIIAVNTILIGLLTFRTIAIDNDKMYIFFIVFYVALFALNLLIWLISVFSKSQLKKDMGTIIVGLVVAFLFLISYITSV